MEPLAPEIIPGQPQVDANTVALYHFDDPATAIVDATGNYTATLFGNAAVTTNPTLYSGVLQLDGNGSYVSTEYLGNTVLNQGTVEAYVDFTQACGGPSPIITAEGPSGKVLSLQVDGDAWLRFYVYHDGGSTLASSGINVCRYLVGPYLYAGNFHHVAATWGPRGTEIWVDGILHGVGYDDFKSDNVYRYFCNPQMQIGIHPWPSNPLYPVCQTPVMAPTMPAYPPGDYTGSLMPYTTFKIGCDSNGACFKGRIDEVRISNIQRTFTWQVAPTITPSPTWTPVNPSSGQYSVDSYTEGLYHFEPSTKCGPNAALEEVYQNCYSFGGNTTYVSNGRFGSAVYLDGGSFIPLPNFGGGTVEAWVDYTNPASVSQPLLLWTGATNIPGAPYYFGAYFPGSTIQLKLNNTGGYLDSGITPADLVGCWHHIAATWGTRGYEIWVDGILRASTPILAGGLNGITGWRLGCAWGANQPCMQGVVDELRVSSMQRIFSAAAKRPVRATFSSPFRTTSGGQPSSGFDASSGFFSFLPMVGIQPTPTSLYPCPP